MTPCRSKLRSNRSVGHLLILGCSGRKCAAKGKLPALDLYDGVNFRVLRTFLSEHGWPPGLCIKILSAKYGLIDALTLIETYDQRLDEAIARQMNRASLKELARFGKPSSFCVNLGKHYLSAIHGIDRLFHGKVVYAEGGIGLKMARMKEWLLSLPNKTATLPGQKAARSYLYFFPDWDDYVREPFVHETDDETDPASQERLYAHEIFGADNTPYDGMLVSLAQIYTGKGAHRGRRRPHRPHRAGVSRSGAAWPGRVLVSPGIRLLLRGVAGSRVPRLRPLRRALSPHAPERSRVGTLLLPSPPYSGERSRVATLLLPSPLSPASGESDCVDCQGRKN